VVHSLVGDHWFDFDCTPPVDLGSTEFRLVPLPGHTRGHSGVALLNKGFRQISKHSPRLRALLREHGDEVTLTCSHDPREFEKFLTI